ncbi:MAG: AraC family transcriptional regulator [Oscillospiraceae bacterium]|nr:AraC family transcriptional regulator [Oscillospiraceae bacterium]
MEEKRRHSSELVPFSYYKCLIPDYFVCVPLHWHGEFEINYVLEGRAEFLCGEDRFVSAEGDIIIIPPNMLHAIYTHDSYEQRYDTIVFSADMLGASENNRCAAECVRPLISGTLGVNVHITKEHHYYSEIKTTVENIFSCAKGNSPQLDMLLKSELLRLFWLLENSGDIYPESEKRLDFSENLRPAIEYINENFTENITVQQLADIVHLSKSYFMGRFRQAAGVGALEYVVQLRIKKACILLKDSRMTAAEIAFECGFRNLSNFNRQFRKAVDCTPIEYRKINRCERCSEVLGKSTNG